MLPLVAATEPVPAETEFLSDYNLSGQATPREAGW